MDTTTALQVGHLLRRATFGGSAGELRAAVGTGLPARFDRLLHLFAVLGPPASIACSEGAEKSIALPELVQRVLPGVGQRLALI